MRDRKDILEEFGIGEAAASWKVSGMTDAEWVDIKERTEIEN